MKEERIFKDRLDLLEREIKTLTERLEALDTALKNMEDLRPEIKGLMLFLGRVHPEFKNQFPGIMQKIKS